MPEFDKLSSYADKAALQAETAFILAEFKKVIAGGDEMVKLLLDAQKKLNFSGAGTKDLAKGIETITQKTELYGKQVTYVAGETKKLAENTQLLKQATQEETASLEKNIEARRRMQNTLQSYLASQKEDLALMKAGTITRAEYNKRFTESQIKIEQYRGKIADLNKSIKEQTSVTEKLTREQKLQNAVYETERNSLGRAQALILLYTEQKKKLNLATEDGRRLNDNYNKAIAASNTFILKNADAETVRTKTVGKYSEAITGAFSKAFGYLRTLANVIPGLGLGGIFLLLSEGIGKAVENLGLFNSRLSDTKRQRELLNTVQQQTAENAGKEIAQLQVLYGVATNTTLSLKARKEAVDELQKQFPTYFKNISDEIILQGKAKDAYDAARNAILEKARAQAIEGELTKLATRELQLLQKRNDLEKEKTKELEKQKAIDARKTSNKDDKELRGLDQFNSISAVSRFNKDLSDANKDLEEIQKDRAFLVGQITTVADPTKTGGGSSASKNASTKAILDSEFELYKIAQLRKIKLAEDELNNENLSFDKRIAALQNFSTLKLQLIEAEKKDELRKNEDKEAALQANLKKAKGTERSNLLIELKNNETARKIIEAKFGAERLKVFDENEKIYTSIVVKRYEERRRKIQESERKINEVVSTEREAAKQLIEKQYSEDITALNNRFAKGEMSQEDYNKKRARLDLAYHIAALKNEIEFAEKLISIRKMLGQDVGKLEADLAKYKMQLSDIETKHLIDNENKKKQAIIDGLNAVKKISQDVFGLVDGLINANTISQKNALREQEDEAEKKASREIEIVNAQAEQGLITQEEATRKLQVIEARKAAQKEQFARREREIELQKARFEKAKAIFNISLEIALALAKGQFFQAALGAAQLAIAIATPLPRYYKGKKKGEAVPGSGMAIVDDGGRMEPIVRADGTVEMGGNTPRVTMLGKDDTVFTSKDAFLKSLENSAMQDVARKSGKSISQDGYTQLMIASMAKNAALGAENQRLLKQIADKPVMGLNVDTNGAESFVMMASRRVTIKNDSCNW